MPTRASKLERLQSPIVRWAGVALALVSCAGLVGCAEGGNDDDQASRARITSMAARAEAIAGLTEAGQEGVLVSATLGAVGSMRGLDERAMAFVRGMTAEIQGKLPDPEAVLEALKAYFAAHADEISSLSEELARVRKDRNKSEQEAYRKGLRRRYEADVEAYEDALATFEEHATPAQLLELNALMRGLSSSLGSAEE